jgi:glycosyltransferase involved in cell wall biosynthesis
VKVVVDAMCAEFGGIRTYVEQLLGRWHELHPSDEVHVVVRAGSTLPTPGLVRHELAVRRPDVLGRPWAQASAMHALVRRLSPDVVLATAPTTNPRRMRPPLAVAVLDLRTELRPEQFSWGRRLLRKISYERTYRLASGFLSISQRTLDDLHRHHPTTQHKPAVVTHLAADHVLEWAAPDRDGPAIAFAHHSNKNPELLVEAWALLPAEEASAGLTFVGVSEELRPRLEELIDRHGLRGTVELAPYLPADQFRTRILRARMIAFPSDFEGFGIPIVEGMLLHKPVVIGPDPACLEVAGGHASVASAWEPAALAEAIRAGFAMDQAALDAAHAWARSFSWSRTVETTHAALAALAAGGARRPTGGRP